MNGTAIGTSSDESGLLPRLSLEQKVRLLTGADAWSLNAISSVGLRTMVVSDGPSGVRGRRFDPRHPSSSLPCPVALGATWDEDLVAAVALALGEETRSRGVDVLLAPTVNIIRTPLSGRGFECFSEDPLLTARIAVAYVRGLQESGIRGYFLYGGPGPASDDPNPPHPVDARRMRDEQFSTGINGRLRMGWLYPATYAQRTYQFTSALNAQLLAGVQAATAPQ